MNPEEDLELETYDYMNYLFWSQPSDKWIFDHINNIDDSLNELVALGHWYPTIPPLDVRESHRYTDKVIKDDMYTITLWRVQYAKEHYEEYTRHAGQVENAKHEGMLDPYFSLRQYCLQNLHGTTDEEIDSIYFVNVYPD